MAYTPLPDFQKWVDAVFRTTKAAFQPVGFPRYGSDGPAPPVEYSELTYYTELGYTKSNKFKTRPIPQFLIKKGKRKEMEEHLQIVWNGWIDSQGNPRPSSMSGFERLGGVNHPPTDTFQLGVGNTATLLGPFSFEGPTMPWIQLCGDTFKPSDSKWEMPRHQNPLGLPLATTTVGEANEYGKEGKGSLNEYFTFQLGDTTVHNFPMQPGYTYVFTNASDTPLMRGSSIWFLTYADEPTPSDISQFEDDQGLFPPLSGVKGFKKITEEPAIYGIMFSGDNNNRWNATIQYLNYGYLKNETKRIGFKQPGWGDRPRTAAVFKNKGPVNGILQLQPLERFEYISELKAIAGKGDMSLYRDAGLIVANFAVGNPAVGWKRVFKKELDKKYPPPPPKKSKKFPPHAAAAASESEKEALEFAKTGKWIKDNYGSGDVK